MRLWKSAKKATKFTFMDMPLSLLGIKHFQMGNNHIVDLWKSLLNPVCPQCDKGVLIMQGDARQIFDQQHDGGTRELYPWVCNNCKFSFFDESDITKVRESAKRYRNARVKVELTDMEYARRAQLAHEHRLFSRAFFIACMLTSIGFLYMLASGASLLLALNWLSIAFTMWVFGMKKSYRSWQVTTGQLFVEGAFWFWFKHEKWIV